MVEISNSNIFAAQELAGKNVSDFTRDDFITYYYALIGISRSVFDEHKRDARNYLESINASDALGELLAVSYYDIQHIETMSSEFFASFDDFYDSLMQRVNTLSIKVDASVFDAQVATLMLAWAGVNPEDAVNVKKSEVNEHSRTVLAGGKSYRIPDKGMEPVVRYARSSRMIKPNSKGLCEMYLRESEYLFRTFKAEKMTQQSLLAGVTTKLNILDGKRFHYGSVRLSGVFSRIATYEQEFGTIRTLPRNMESDAKASYMGEMARLFEQDFANETILKQRLAQYKAYKTYYHKKK